MQIKPFADTAEMVEAINSREYATDANFRALVEARMAAGDPSHGGQTTGNSGALTFGGSNSPGGFSVKIGSDHRESGGASSTSIDPTATYESDTGINSAQDLVNVVNTHEYKTNPAVREAVAWAIANMGGQKPDRF